MPQIASTPTSIAANANGIRLRRPPIRRTSCSFARCVDDDAGAEEQLRFEKRVREKVQDARFVRADADAHDHVADLRHRRIGENPFDVPLRASRGSRR